MRSLLGIGSMLGTQQLLPTTMRSGTLNSAEAGDLRDYNMSTKQTVQVVEVHKCRSPTQSVTHTSRNE